MADSFTIVFIDILGFGELVTTFDELVETLDEPYYIPTSQEDFQDSAWDSPNPLTHVFTTFHHAIDIEVARRMKVDTIETISFSDSAFVIFKNASIALDFARDLMRTLIEFRVPVRMGIGSGSFRRSRFAIDITETVRRQAAQFYGTAVVRAHAAESCGLKGLRIFLHPDFVMPPQSQASMCAVTDAVKCTRLPVTHEINYLDDCPAYIPSERSAATVNASLVQRIEEMKANADAKYKSVYDSTLTAITSMQKLLDAGQ